MVSNLRESGLQHRLCKVECPSFGRVSSWTKCLLIMIKGKEIFSHVTPVLTWTGLDWTGRCLMVESASSWTPGLFDINQIQTWREMRDRRRHETGGRRHRRPFFISTTLIPPEIKLKLGFIIWLETVRGNISPVILFLFLN